MTFINRYTYKTKLRYNIAVKSQKINSRRIRLLFITVAFVLYISAVNATVYYVSCSSGNDSNNGKLISSAWNTLGKVNATSFSPGDKILFKRGDSWRGTIIVSNSGNSDTPVTYGAYGNGEKPIITGFQNISGWTDEGGGIYSKVIKPESPPNMLVIDGVQHAMGRYPNGSHLTFESVDSNISITDHQLSSSPDWTGAEAVSILF